MRLIPYLPLFAQNFGQIATIIVILVLLVLGLVLFAIFARYFRLWIQSVTTGAGIGIFDLLGMTFRKVNPTIIVRSKIMAVQAGLGEETGITSKALEAHYLAGGRVPLVIQAMIAARKAKIINLDYRLATAIDLAGRDVLEAVRTSVYPKVIDCPGRASGRDSLDAVAKNGIQLKVKARVTVRANLNQLIGGATEETIIARVGEGIVSAIGSLERLTWRYSPSLTEFRRQCSRAASTRKRRLRSCRSTLPTSTWETTSALGSQADQAEADMRVARANAESRRAMAVASEQEKIAQIEESRSKLVEAEAEVPLAIADAFRAGNLGIMDYYKLRNVQADTEMRRSIAGSGSPATHSTTV